MLKWVCHLDLLIHPRRVHQGLIMTVRNKFVREILASLKNSMITLLCRSEVTVETAVTELESLNIMRIIRS